MKLVIEDEAGTRSVVPFAADEIVVGRAAEGVTFRLADRNVSRRHARFVRQSGAVLVEDLGSLNGTWVNGERIAARRKLREGDLVQIGDYDLALLGEGQAIAPGAPPPLPSEATAPTRKLAAVVEPTVPETPAAVVAPPPRPARRTLRIVLAVAVLAIVVGLAAGWAAGALR